MHKDKHNNYYITDATRFRKQSGQREQEILKTAQWDGEDTYIVFQIDPGAAGKDGFRQATKMYLEEGFVVKRDPLPPTKSKLQKFEPFSTAAQNGQVYIVEELFSDKEMVKILYDELESFTGERSTAARKDD
jgi:phage terminase large subunit-like protein